MNDHNKKEIGVKHISHSPQRYEQLDALRGLAALIVVLYHFTIVFPNRNGLIWNIIQHTPLQVFVSGRQSVVFFFVLSGFVLSLSYFKQPYPSYMGFMSKRVFRLYIPYAVALLAALTARLSFSRGEIMGLGSWFNQQWITPLSPGLIIKHFLLVLNFNNYALDGVVWSLIQEMRISIIFPFLMILVIRFNWKLPIGVSLLMVAIGVEFQHVYHSGLQPWYKTLPYVLTFLFGVYTARYKAQLIAWCSRLPVVMKLTATVLGILLFGSTQWLGTNSSINDFETMIGAVLLIVLSLSSSLFSRVLTIAPIQFLGRISYSLYLYHLIILLSLLHLLYGKINLGLILLLTLILSVAVSSLAWWLVERPSTRIGRQVYAYLLRLRPSIPTSVEDQRKTHSVVGIKRQS